MSTSTSVSASYRNPILPGFNPDPSIIRVGRDYFVITSTFEYFPGIPLYHSTDLINWTLLGHVLSRPSQLDLRACEPGMGVFAPTVGIVGAIQAAEALRVIGEIGEPLVGRLMMLDSLRMEWNTMRIARQPDCPVCGEQHT